MAPRPPQSVYDAFIAPTARITRRVEIYERDGVTPWRSQNWNRLVEGSVAVDQSRDDRRNFELSLDNFDGAFDHSPSGLWYDKVYKLFYGVDVNEEARVPNIVIAEEYNCEGEAVNLKQRLASAGFYSVRIKTTATTYADVADYDMVISLSADYPRKMALLNEAYGKGKHVMTGAPSATAATMPNLISAVGSVTAASDATVKPNSATAHPANTGWTDFVVPTFAHTPVVSAPSGVATPAFVTSTDQVLLATQNGIGSRWAHVTTNKFGPTSHQTDDRFTAFVKAFVGWVTQSTTIDYWECQIGEFLADIIQDDDEELTQVSGRDYTKRCMDSKLVAATMFIKGTKLEDAIKTLALNSGIVKMNLPATGKTITKDSTYEADTERWKIMKEFATSLGYELFFDNAGTLTLREVRDPYTTPPELVLSTGERGNLIKQGKRASDTSLKNHIVVAGESNDSTIPPVYAEAKNTMVGSASNIETIGDRVQRYTSPMVTTVAQAQDLANTYLRVASLEEFELNFTSVLFPWLEAGDILENAAPVRDTDKYNPTRYLISSFTLPMDLGPMTGNGKRVTIVL